MSGQVVLNKLEAEIDSITKKILSYRKDLRSAGGAHAMNLVMAIEHYEGKFEGLLKAKQLLEENEKASVSGS